MGNSARGAAGCILGGLLLAFAGCGGGSDGGPTGSADGVAGTYHIVGFDGFRGDDRYSRAGWGTWVVDAAAEQVEGETVENVYAPPVPPSGSDIVGPVAFGPAFLWGRDDEDLTVEELHRYEGGATEDGRVAGLAAIGAGDDPAVRLLLRRAGSFTTASLTGDYHIFLFGHDHAAMAGAAYRGTTTFDGAGGGTTTFHDRNVDGMIDGTLGPLATSYTLAADGTMTFDVAASTYQGGLLGGGDLGLLAGSTDAADPVRGLIVLIRESTSAGVSNFDGRYTRVSIGRRDGVGWDGIVEDVVASGTGDWSYTGGSHNGDGVIYERVATAPFTCTVAPDGTWETGPLRGAVSPDGRFAVWMLFGLNTNPAISLLVR